MFRDIFSKATRKMKEADVNGSIISVKKKISSALSTTNEKKDIVIEKYWPVIEKIIYKDMLGVAENKLQDDQSLKGIFETAYDVIPSPIRLVLSEDKFVDFCMKRKSLLLDKVSKYKKADESSKLKINTEYESPIDASSIGLSVYENLLAELVALCICADGDVENTEKVSIIDIINNDDYIENKERTIELLFENIDILVSCRKKNNTVFQLKSNSIINKLASVDQENEKHRIVIILEGIFDSVQEGSISETKKMVDSIINKMSLSE